MMISETRIEPASSRNHRSNSLGPGAFVLLFGVGYAVWQPLSVVLNHLLWGDPLPYATVAGWALCVLVAAALGAAAGAAMYRVRRMRPSRWRQWAQATLGLIPICLVLPNLYFDPARPVRWLAELLIVSMAMGALFGLGLSARAGRSPFAERSTSPVA